MTLQGIYRRKGLHIFTNSVRFYVYYLSHTLLNSQIQGGEGRRAGVTFSNYIEKRQTATFVGERKNCSNQREASKTIALYLAFSCQWRESLSQKINRSRARKLSASFPKIRPRFCRICDINDT